MAQYNSIKRVLDFEDSDDDLLESDFVSPFYADGLNYGNTISRDMSITEKYLIPKKAATTVKTRQNAKSLKSSKFLKTFPLIFAAALVSIYLFKNASFNPLKIFKVPNSTWKQLESINKELLNWYKDYSETYRGEFVEAEFTDRMKARSALIENIVTSTCQDAEARLKNENLAEFRENIYKDVVTPHLEKVNWAVYQECYSALNHLAAVGVKQDPSLYGKFEGFHILNFLGKVPYRIKTQETDNFNFVDVKDVKQRIDGLVNIFQRAEVLLQKPYNIFIQYTDLFTTDDELEIEEQIKGLKKYL